MSNSGGIRAGRAYVELGANDSLLTKGLRSAQAKLKSFGRGFSVAGGVVAAAGSSALAPMLAATTAFASSGDELSKAADKTGASVESLSELRHAATQSAVSFKTLGTALNKSQRNLAEAAKGDLVAAEAFDALGLSVDELIQMSPDQQFEAIADRISKIEDPAMRTAAAMDVFGKSGAELMPLILGGAEGIESLRAEARALGLQVSGKDASAATLLGDTWANVKKTLGAVVFQVGAALAPALTDVMKAITPLIVGVAKWMSRNRKLIVTIAAIAAGLVAAGTFLLGVGGAFMLLSSAIGGFLAIGSAAAAVIASILSPIGLAVTAVGGLIAAFLTMTDTGQAVVAWFAGGFSFLLKTVQATIGGLYNALASGRLDLAAEIAMTGVKLIFATALGAITGMFGGSIDSMMQMLTGLYRRIKQVFSRFEKLRQAAINKTSSIIASLGFGSGEDERGRRLEAERKRLLQSKGESYTSNDTSLAANLSQMQSDSLAAADDNIAAADAIDTTALGKEWAAAFDPEALQQRLDQLNRTAAEAKAATEEAAAAVPPARDPSMLELEDLQAGIQSGLQQSQTAVGTFSAREAQQLGAVSWQDRVAKGIDKIAKNTDPKNFGQLVATA